MSEFRRELAYYCVGGNCVVDGVSMYMERNVIKGTHKSSLKYSFELFTSLLLSYHHLLWPSLSLLCMSC